MKDFFQSNLVLEILKTTVFSRIRCALASLNARYRLFTIRARNRQKLQASKRFLCLRHICEFARDIDLRFLLFLAARKTHDLKVAAGNGRDLSVILFSKPYNGSQVTEN